MTPSRRGDPGRARTPAERERDRQERERRRARERGASSPLSGDPPLDFDAVPDDAWSEPPAAYPHYDADPDPGPPPPDFSDPAPPPYAYDGHPGYDDQPQFAAPPESYAAPPESYAAPPEPDLGPHPDEGMLPPPTGEVRRAGRPPAAGGVPAALDRAQAALSGVVAGARARAAARLGRTDTTGTADRPAARARASGRLGRTEPTGTADRPGARARAAGRLRRTDATGAAGRPTRGAGSLRGPLRPAVRARTTTTSVSKTKRTLARPGAPASRRGRIGAVVALAAVVFVLWFLFSLFQPFKGSGHGTVAVDIPTGASSSTIATLLADRGVVSSAFFFKLRATLGGKRSSLESGHFVLHKDMSYGAALDALTGTQGHAAQIKVTIPEGLSRTEIAVLARHDGVSGDYVKASQHSHLLKPKTYGASAAHTLEGFLFPSTYDLLPGDPASKLVNAQLEAFKVNIAKVDLSRAHSKHLTTYDVLTIASMVEREAQLPKERKLIAAVIYNRLHSGMPLGIDATIRYAINDYARPLTDADLKLNSPYNTRLHKGLPPTPIGNPGLASIEAAAHPAAVSYQYYVVKPGTCGEHAFSSTFAQFEQDAARYNNARAAKGGKSPTTCSTP